MSIPRHRVGMSGEGRVSAERTPKEIMSGFFEPKSRLAHMVVKMKDIVGAVASVNRIVAGLGIDIRQSMTYSVPEEGHAIYSAFLNFNDSKVTSAKLTESLRRSEFVLEARVIEGREGAIFDTVTFPTNWQGRRVVILAQHAMAKMFEHIHSMLGSGGAVLLYEQGMEYGRDLAQFFNDQLGKDYILRNYDYGLNLFAATGWGIAERREGEGDFPNATIRISHCFECEGRSSAEPACHFVRGFLTGIVGTLTEYGVRCKETSCGAKGDSYCAFEIRRHGE